MEDREKALIAKTIFEELEKLEAGIAGLENYIRDEDTDVTTAWLAFGELTGRSYAITQISVYGLDSAGKVEFYDRIRKADKARTRLFKELLKVTYK